MYDYVPVNKEYETPAVNVPVITESNYVNTNPKESQEIDPIYSYVNVYNEHYN